MPALLAATFPVLYTANFKQLARTDEDQANYEKNY